MHYAQKHRIHCLTTNHEAKKSSTRDIDLFIILVERRLQKFPAHHSRPIHSKAPLFQVNRADLVYLATGHTASAIDEWLAQMSRLFEQINFYQVCVLYFNLEA